MARKDAGYATYGIWFFDELAHLIGYGNRDIILNGYSVGVSSIRLQCISANPTCVACGATGVLWILQKSMSKKGRISDHAMPHLNLWALGNEDELILMTHDHIFPRSKGGPDTIENSQTMCAYCNEEKGNALPPTSPDMSHTVLPIQSLYLSA